MTPRENYLRMLRGEIPEFIPSYFEPHLAMVEEELLTPNRAPNGPIVTALGVTYVGSPDDNYGAMPKPGEILVDDICKWRDIVKIPDLSGRDWEGYYKSKLKDVDREKQAVSAGGGDYFLTLVSLLGFENTLFALYEEPEEVKELEKSIDGYDPVLVLEFDDLMVVGFNVSTSNMTAAGLARFKEAYAKRKPIILVTHVPIDPLVEPRVGEVYKERDPKRRNLTWGDDCYYKPNAHTREFIDLVCAEDSPVKTVLAGHLHFSWHGMLTKTISQHLFVPSYKGNIGVIRVKAK